MKIVDYYTMTYFDGFMMLYFGLICSMFGACITWLLDWLVSRFKNKSNESHNEKCNDKK